MSKRSCFVAMPFSDRTLTPHGIAPWNELYVDHIKPAVERAELRCFRADEIARPGSITADVVEAVASSFLVVAEMTGQNPNVFYELGVRHALSRRTILLSQSAADIPFDLRDSRAIIYSFTPRGAKQLEQAIERAIGEVLQNPDHSDNPVQSFLLKNFGSREGVSLADRDFQLLTETQTLLRERSELSATVGEFQSVLRIARTDATASDLVGTWTDQFFDRLEEKYIREHDGLVVMAYGGAWPGCAVGRFDGELFRFDWSRFDRTFGGTGALRLVNPTRLEGGVWFGNGRGAGGNSEPFTFERHAMTRKSLQILPSGMQWFERAGELSGDVPWGDATLPIT